MRPTRNWQKLGTLRFVHSGELTTVAGPLQQMPIGPLFRINDFLGPTYSINDPIGSPSNVYLKLMICNYSKTADKYKRSEEMIQRFLRVDHAGEVGANDIYAGQMAVLGRSEVAPLIQVVQGVMDHMLS